MEDIIYHGYKIGERVVLTETIYDYNVKISEGTEFTIKSFPPKVKKESNHSNVPERMRKFFAYGKSDDKKNEIRVNLCQIRKK